MNKRRLSYGLLVTLAATAFAVGCGDSTPDPATAPQPTAAASADPAPSATAVADVTPTAAPEPPPPPPKPAKDKWIGSFAQDFSGDVMNTADAAAKKKAGAKDPDNKKYNAAMDKAKAAITGTVVNTADGSVWSVKGKAVHTVVVKVVKGDDPNSLAIQFVKDGKKDLKTPIDVAVTFTDDNTFTVKDPWAKKADSAQTLVFKRQ